MKRLYVAHQLKYRKDIYEIINNLRLHLPNIEFFNPFYSEIRNEILLMDKGLKNRFDFSLSECKRIVNKDLENIRKSDGVLCIIFDNDSLGSFMEVFYASHILRIPVYYICINEKLLNHLWMKALTIRFRNIIEFIRYMKEKQ